MINMITSCIIVEQRGLRMQKKTVQQAMFSL